MWCIDVSSGGLPNNFVRFFDADSSENCEEMKKKRSFV